LKKISAVNLLRGNWLNQVKFKNVGVGVCAYAYAHGNCKVVIISYNFTNFISKKSAWNGL